MNQKNKKSLNLDQDLQTNQEAIRYNFFNVKREKTKNKYKI